MCTSVHLWRRRRRRLRRRPLNVCENHLRHRILDAVSASRFSSPNYQTGELKPTHANTHTDTPTIFSSFHTLGNFVSAKCTRTHECICSRRMGTTASQSVGVRSCLKWKSFQNEKCQWSRGDIEHSHAVSAERNERKRKRSRTTTKMEKKSGKKYVRETISNMAVWMIKRNENLGEEKKNVRGHKAQRRAGNTYYGEMWEKKKIRQVAGFLCCYNFSESILNWLHLIYKNNQIWSEIIKWILVAANAESNSFALGEKPHAVVHHDWCDTTTATYNLPLICQQRTEAHTHNSYENENENENGSGETLKEIQSLLHTHTNTHRAQLPLVRAEWLGPVGDELRITISAVRARRRRRLHSFFSPSPWPPSSPSPLLQDAMALALQINISNVVHFH